MDILIGTKNPYKSVEMINFIKNLKDIKIHYLDEIKQNIKIEEDQNSLKGNAEKKAVEISKYCDYIVLTSDGGVDIPRLGEKWDILKNQRTVGENKTDRKKINILINLMAGLEEQDRKCTYHLALALAKQGQLIWSFEDIYDKGYIVKKPNKSKIPNGMWMGFIWFYPQYQKVFTNLNQQELTEIRKQGNKIKTNLQQKLKNIKTTLK